ncbi:hypothetical protein ALC53_01180 [Atta colombica]|uniref:Uncharacterized protein n=1 Tax=Atta colombica TaxID=520822 RepID=A0A195BU60_9HYME|nr:hypothetical protein ALC53_01180 [Atta colombica]
MATENRTPASRPVRIEVEWDTDEEQENERKRLHSSYIIDSKPSGSDSPSEIQLCDPKKARTRARMETGQIVSRRYRCFRFGKGRIGRKSTSPRIWHIMAIQYESINSKTLADIVSRYKKKLILWNLGDICSNFSINSINEKIIHANIMRVASVKGNSIRAGIASELKFCVIPDNAYPYSIDHSSNIAGTLQRSINIAVTIVNVTVMLLQAFVLCG